MHLILFFRLLTPRPPLHLYFPLFLFLHSSSSPFFSLPDPPPPPPRLSLNPPTPLGLGTSFPPHPCPFTHLTPPPPPFLVLFPIFFSLPGQFPPLHVPSSYSWFFFLIPVLSLPDRPTPPLILPPPVFPIPYPTSNFVLLYPNLTPSFPRFLSSPSPNFAFSTPIPRIRLSPTPIHPLNFVLLYLYPPPPPSLSFPHSPGSVPLTSSFPIPDFPSRRPSAIPVLVLFPLSCILLPPPFPSATFVFSLSPLPLSRLHSLLLCLFALLPSSIDCHTVSSPSRFPSLYPSSSSFFAAFSSPLYLPLPLPLFCSSWKSQHLGSRLRAVMQGKLVLTIRCYLSRCGKLYSFLTLHVPTPCVLHTLIKSRQGGPETICSFVLESHGRLRRGRWMEGWGWGGGG
ncbi:hypothetical protein C7M84_017797 [Penaeus vannamei]|uniref:Uncharacterized protein n=1 Tax=Penaeus vannamei TaxID=6689 RepID=A0A3R7PZA9_PENVA|nr:hypothetical protein C7M84_017797 [Penaeus vannamei]